MSTFTEMQKLSEDFEQVGVYTVIVTADMLMPWLQFKGIDGNAYQYERELTNPQAASVDAEGELADTAMTFTSKSETLRDVYVQSPMNLKTVSLARKQDPLAILKVKMAKSYGRKLADLVVNGDSAVDALQFDGLLKKARDETRMLAMDDGALDGPGTVETELTLDRMHQAHDKVELGPSGEPQILIGNKTMRRKITSLMYASGGGIELPSIDMFGRRVKTVDDVPYIVSDYLADDENYADSSTWPSSTATSLIFTSFGEENEAFTLLHGPGGFFATEFQNLGKRKNKNEEVWRLIGYPGSVLYAPKTLCALGGIDSTA
jgi:hypothetical protein